MKRLRIIQTDRTALFDDDEFEEDNLINNNNQENDLGSNTWLLRGLFFVQSV